MLSHCTILLLSFHSTTLLLTFTLKACWSSMFLQKGTQQIWDLCEYWFLFSLSRSFCIQAEDFCIVLFLLPIYYVILVWCKVKSVRPARFSRQAAFFKYYLLTAGNVAWKLHLFYIQWAEIRFVLGILSRSSVHLLYNILLWWTDKLMHRWITLDRLAC